jgi:hypothetical protein
MAKLLEDALGNWEYVMLVIILICVVWLLARSMGWSLSMSKQGFLSDLSSTLAFRSISDSGYPSAGRQDSAGQSVQQERQNFAVRRMGMSNMEPPVFWNPGSFSDVSVAQLASIGLESNLSNTDATEMNTPEPKAASNVALTGAPNVALVSNSTAPFAVRRNAAAGGYADGFQTTFSEGGGNAALSPY